MRIKRTLWITFWYKKMHSSCYLTMCVVLKSCSLWIDPEKQCTYLSNSQHFLSLYSLLMIISYQNRHFWNWIFWNCSHSNFHSGQSMEKPDHGANKCYMKTIVVKIYEKFHLIKQRKWNIEIIISFSIY